MAPQSGDWGLVLLLTIGMQGVIMLLDRRKPPVAQRSEADQLRHYRQSYILFIVALLLILATWLAFSRPLAGLGLELGSGWAAVAGWGFAIGATVVLSVNVIGVRTNEQWRRKAADDIARTPGMEDMLPRSPAEYRSFLGLSVLGGTVEEIIYRGYLIWVLSAVVDPWLAGLISLLFFIIAHTYYSSWAGHLKVAIAGALFTALYLLSGTLLPCILLHIAMDMTSGMVAWHARSAKTGHDTAP